MTNTGNVPFVDLQTPHRELEAELVAAFKRKPCGQRALSEDRRLTDSSANSRIFATRNTQWASPAEPTRCVLP